MAVALARARHRAWSMSYPASTISHKEEEIWTLRSWIRVALTETVRSPSVWGIL